MLSFLFKGFEFEGGGLGGRGLLVLPDADFAEREGDAESSNAFGSEGGAFSFCLREDLCFKELGFGEDGFSVEGFALKIPPLGCMKLFMVNRNLEREKREEKGREGEETLEMKGGKSWLRQERERQRQRKGERKVAVIRGGVGGRDFELGYQTLLLVTCVTFIFIPRNKKI